MTENAPGVKILVVDDSEDTRELVARLLEPKGHQVFRAADAPGAALVIGREKIDLVITDYKMPGSTGIDLARHLRDNHPDTGVIMVTGYASVEGAVEAVKSGVEEYIPKPFTDQELYRAVDSSLKKLALRRVSSPGYKHPGPRHGIIGSSPAMQNLFRVLDKSARAPATVLITGESGTGKELVARAIHYLSPRASCPFVPVNCGAIPDNLLESELFGHVKGAFTGATVTRAGFFRTADGGTIFLDEVGDTSESMQAKLLRVLQDRQVCMVGSSHPQPVDIRVLAATNRDLGAMVEQGRFRPDLFYRLNVIPIQLPPLRDRGNDVILLARHFADKVAGEMGRTPLGFSQEVLQAFCSYDWPGNVRELENVLQRMIILSEGDILDAGSLPIHMRHTVPLGLNTNRTLAQVEAEHIRNVLAHTNGNRTATASILGIDRKTLRSKINRYNIE